MADFLRSNDYIVPAYRKETDAFVAGGGDRSIREGFSTGNDHNVAAAPKDPWKKNDLKNCGKDYQ